MKSIKLRYLCGLFVMMAVMASVWPHHHHGHRFCAVVEMCAQDHAVNDRHTAHHDEGGDRHVCQLQPLAVETASAFHPAFDFIPLALQGENVCIAPPVSEAARHYIIYNVRARALALPAVKALRAPPSVL